MYMPSLLHRRHPCLLILAAALLAVGCQRQAESPTAATAPAVSAATVPEEVTDDGLKDVAERTPSYIVGITYPRGLETQPGLAKVLTAYADGVHTDLREAVAALGNDRPMAPYELSLSFEKILDTPRLLAVAADGSLYTGGAHGMPLMQRFVWLPQQSRLLTARELIVDEDGWQAISVYVANQLRHAAAARADADQLAPEERQALLDGAGKMIAEGTAPKADNFAQFEPIVDGTGRITAVRFVFPPYQVGPYSDGTQSVDVPASILLPHVAAAYRDLFVH